MFTYTNDERFQVLHGEGSDDWTLQIKYVQKRDNGTYECQVREKVLFIIIFWREGQARPSLSANSYYEPVYISFSNIRRLIFDKTLFQRKVYVTFKLSLNF